MSNIQIQENIKCEVCRKKCNSEVHKYVTRHNMYYDKDSKLQISKSWINYLNNNENKI